MGPFTIFLLTSTIFQAKTQIDAGKTAEKNLKFQAKQEEIASKGEELKRRERLNQVLSANIQSAASSGVGFEGSTQSIALDNARKVSMSEASESLSSKMRQDLLRRQGKAKAAQGQSQAFSTLLSGGAKAYSLR